jgi:hypothetical protein
LLKGKVLDAYIWEKLIKISVLFIAVELSNDRFKYVSVNDATYLTDFV